MLLPFFALNENLPGVLVMECFLSLKYSFSGSGLINIKAVK